jgi:hypothetical protein
MGNTVHLDPSNKKTAGYVELMTKQGKQIFFLQFLTLLVATGSLILSFIALKNVSCESRQVQAQVDNM